MDVTEESKLVTAVKKRGPKDMAPESDEDGDGDEFVPTQLNKSRKKNQKKQRKDARRAVSQPAAALGESLPCFRLFFLSRNRHV